MQTNTTAMPLHNALSQEFSTHSESSIPEDDAPITKIDELLEPEPGQVVAHGVSAFGPCFRCVLEVLEHERYLVQEFCAKQGEKRSDPYVMTSKKAVYSTYFDCWQHTFAHIDGSYTLWSNQGQKFIQGNFNKDGFKHGQWDYWSVDGQKLIEEHYDKGVLHGPWQRWSYGVKFITGQYAHGKKTNTWTYWWFNGQLQAQGNYYAGMPHGQWRWWRKDGIKFIQGSFESGRKIGIWLRWDSRGQLAAKKDYRKDVFDIIKWLKNKYNINIDREKTLEQDLLIRERVELCNLYNSGAGLYSREFLGITVEGYYVVRDFHAVGDEKFTEPYCLLDRDAIFEKEFDFWSPSWRIQGAYTQSHSNGRKCLEMHFEQGKRNGLQIDWDENGNKISEKYFHNNALNGFYHIWYPSGQLSETRYYSHGVRAGLWVAWWENGEKKCQGNFLNDLLHGRWNWWHSNSIDKAQGQYNQGRKVGTWHWWDASFKLLESIDYGNELQTIPEWLQREYNIQVAEPTAQLNQPDWEKDGESLTLPSGYRFDVYDIDFTNVYGRMYLGVTPEGFDIVQDFYWDEGDRQRTIPYLLQDKNCPVLLYCEVDDLQRCGIEGQYKQWYPNGKLEFKGFMKNGRPVGLWKWWNQLGYLVKTFNYSSKE